MTAIAVCGLIHESNAFAEATTTLEQFVRFDSAAIGAIGRASGTEVGGALLEADERGVDAIATTVAMAISSGLVEDDAASVLVAELVDAVAAAGPLDGVVVCLHGSMGAVSDPDVEGTVLSDLRARLGPEVPIVATLDWHCSITPPMVDAADALVAYRTYPHIDQEQRGRDAMAVAASLAGGSPRLESAWVPVPLLVAGPQTRHDAPAMSAVLELGRALAASDDRIVDWSICPGFARSDSAWSGTHVYVVSTDVELSQRTARRLALELWERRREFTPEVAAPAPAVDEALEVVASRGGPVVLSDQGDNPGGGAPGTSTALLSELHRRRPPGALVASLCAPEAVARCHEAGVGSAIDLDLGDLTLAVTVHSVADGKYVIQSPTHPNVPHDIGACAHVRSAHGLGIVLTSTPVQNEDLQLFDLLDVDPTSASVLVVKSNAHFRAAFEPIATAVIDVDTPGISTPVLTRLSYRSVRRPIWPLDPDLDWTPG